MSKPFSFILIPVIHSLRDVRVKVPSAVRKSDTVVLHCYYDMEGDSLYSVKWYKGEKFLFFFNQNLSSKKFPGRREFYRYSPKETPPMKSFLLPGVHVLVRSF